MVLANFGEFRCTICNARFFLEWANSDPLSHEYDTCPFCPKCGSPQHDERRGRVPSGQRADVAR